MASLYKHERIATLAVFTLAGGAILVGLLGGIAEWVLG